jgi:hypothetical protein
MASAPAPSKSRRRGRTLLLFAGLAGAVGLVVVVGIVVFYAIVLRDFFGPGQRPFDPVVWRSHPGRFDRGSIRQMMSDDLLRKHPLLGKSRLEVETLLGPADTTEYFPDYDMEYLLGQERGFGVDAEWLIIRLDSADKVVEAKRVRT